MSRGPWRSDVRAGFTVSLFTMAVTLFMLARALRRRVRTAAGDSVCPVDLPGGRAPVWRRSEQHHVGGAVLVSLLAVAVGAGILQLVCYSGVKQYTDQRKFDTTR